MWTYYTCIVLQANELHQSTTDVIIIAAELRQIEVLIAIVGVALVDDEVGIELKHLSPAHVAPARLEVLLALVFRLVQRRNLLFPLTNTDKPIII